VSVVASIMLGPHRPSNEGHQPTGPAESRRYQVNPGAEHEQRADKIQQPTDAVGLHSFRSGKPSTNQIVAIVNRVAMSMLEKRRRNYRIAYETGEC